MRRSSSFVSRHSVFASRIAAGAALFMVLGMAARSAARKLRVVRSSASGTFARPPLPSEAVLVISPHAGRSRKLARARRALDKHRILVAEELEIKHVDRLPELLRAPSGEPRLVIAAGGDGTVGSVAGFLAGADNALGILPLGTGNDFARSLDIPLNARRAARLLVNGEISSVDLGRLTRPAQPLAYFAHAATVGLNVDFAKLAIRASVRGRLGRPLARSLDGELDGSLPGLFEAVAGGLRIVVPAARNESPPLTATQPTRKTRCPASDLGGRPGARPPR